MTYYKRVRRLDQWLFVFSIVFPFMLGILSAGSIIYVNAFHSALLTQLLILFHICFLSLATLLIGRACVKTKNELYLQKRLPNVRRLLMMVLKNITFFPRNLKYFLLGK